MYSNPPTSTAYGHATRRPSRNVHLIMVDNKMTLATCVSHAFDGGRGIDLVCRPEQHKRIQDRWVRENTVSVAPGTILEANGLIYGWVLGPGENEFGCRLMYPAVLLVEDGIPALTLARQNEFVA
ncbi:hypothetical protein HKX48_001778 [Thoreauomyces humboldtii]|nr:hypothetical protein HKX48_001778 [Thoreauomyces humboldtii]